MQASPGKAAASRNAQWLLEVFLFAIPLLIVGITTKILALREGGFNDLNVMLGVSKLSLYQLIRLFSGDCWEALVLFPLLLLATGRLLPASSRKWLYFLLLEVALFVEFAEAGTYHLIGEFFSKELAGDFIQTLRTNPGFVSPRALMTNNMQWAFWAFIFWGILPLVLSFFLARAAALKHNAARHWKAAIACLGLLLVIVGPMPLNAAGANVYRLGSLARAADELTKSSAASDMTADDFFDTPPRDSYEQLAFPDGAPSEEELEPVPVQHTRPNIIFVVLETAGYKDYPLSGARCRMAHLASLLPHALLAEQHYSTEAESIRSGFSLLSSLYELPGQGENQYFIKHLKGAKNPRPLDSLPRILADEGYATRYYFPFTLWPKKFEEESLRFLGFQDIRIAKEMPLDKEGEAASPFASPAPLRMTEERAMYEMAMDDIDGFHSAGQPFFLALVASIGHAPYPDVRPAAIIAAGPNPSRDDLIGGLAEFQDQLIGELVEKLRHLGILDDTVIVVTGDHGPRTRREDPDMDVKFADEENYHVPLLIWYGRGFPQPVVVRDLTSHIDIVPTILQLLGDHKTYMHQGISMLNGSIKRRVTFFSDWHFRGFDSAHYEGEFVMYSHSNGALYENHSFHFSAGNQATNLPPGARAERMAADIVAFRRLQRVWISYFRSTGTVTGDVRIAKPQTLKQ